MKKFLEWLQFLRAVIASYRATVGKPQADPEPTTTAEAEDQRTWEEAEAERKRLREQDDETFWRGGD